MIFSFASVQKCRIRVKENRDKKYDVCREKVTIAFEWIHHSYHESFSNSVHFIGLDSGFAERRIGRKSFARGHHVSRVGRGVISMVSAFNTILKFHRHLPALCGLQVNRSIREGTRILRNKRSKWGDCHLPNLSNIRIKIGQSDAGMCLWRQIRVPAFAATFFHSNAAHRFAAWEQMHLNVAIFPWTERPWTG